MSNNRYNLQLISTIYNNNKLLISNCLERSCEKKVFFGKWNSDEKAKPKGKSLIFRHFKKVQKKFSLLFWKFSQFIKIFSQEKKFLSFPFDFFFERFRWLWANRLFTLLQADKIWDRLMRRKTEKENIVTFRKQTIQKLST